MMKEEQQQKVVREEMETKMKNWEEERESSSNIIHELSLEIGRLKGSRLENSETDSGCHLQDEMFTELPVRIDELEAELRVLREHNACLVDKNQELEGEILNKGLKEGKEILHGQMNSKTLAAELRVLREHNACPV